MFLWVALDEAVAIHKVDLTTGTVGLPFGSTGNGGIYHPSTVTARIVLPGSDNSVVVSTNGEYGQAIAIYDNGVFRGTPSNFLGIYNHVRAYLPCLYSPKPSFGGGVTAPFINSAPPLYQSIFRVTTITAASTANSISDPRINALSSLINNP